MKTLKKSLIGFVFSLLCVLPVIADEPVPSVYEQAMTACLQQLDTVRSTDGYQQCKVQLERILNLGVNSMIPDYYLAYCNLQMAYRETDPARKTLLLGEAEKQLNKIGARKLDNRDASEYETLTGYYYTALITLDPGANGQRYFARVRRPIKKRLL